MESGCGDEEGRSASVSVSDPIALAMSHGARFEKSGSAIDKISRVGAVYVCLPSTLMT